MNNIVVAFQKEQNARSIKKILTQSGYTVTSVCQTGAAAIANARNLESGILVCGSNFVDMMYTEIYEYLPESFQMLLVASPNAIDNRFVIKDPERLVSLYFPIKVHELLETVEMMDYSANRRRKKRKQQKRKQGRTEEEKKLISQAKGILMERNNMTEDEAHRYIQKRSMENGVGFVETSQMIISLLGQV
ncbi:response regulator NasT [Lachnospiraceae bacterium C7]|nr:response regulator NasT [Lachnospiraceae bacterium C7]